MNDLGITYCHFNPVGMKKREKNLFDFKESIQNQIPPKTPIVSVEATYLNQSPISSPTIHLKADEMNIMWQKENLLNIGIRELIRQGCTKVVWIDADIIFLDNNWFKKCHILLDEFPLIQLFEDIHYEESDMSRDKQKGFFCQHLSKEFVKRMPPGGALAARIEAIPNLLLDRFIAGGADRKMASSWIEKDKAQKTKMKEDCKNTNGEMFLKSWLDWESKTPLNIKVSFLKSTVVHLYHGEHKNRKYTDRHEITRHIKDDAFFKDDSGLWRWSSNYQYIPETIKRYFHSRKEDSDYKIKLL